LAATELLFWRESLNSNFNETLDVMQLTNIDGIIEFVSGLPGVVALTADEASGAPEIAWGDTFIHYDRDGDARAAAQRMPFATVVIKDYPGFDTASDLDRPGVFRVNIGVGRATFTELLGYPPAAHAQRTAQLDYTALDRLIPHPAYATQAWVSILNPGKETAELARVLLTEAHARAARRPG
jgi:hypothetical protein